MRLKEVAEGEEWMVMVDGERMRGNNSTRRSWYSSRQRCAYEDERSCLNFMYSYRIEQKQ
jgi:hypothetical protein